MHAGSDRWALVTGIVALALAPAVDLVLPEGSVLLAVLGFALLGLGAAGWLVWLAAAGGAAYLGIFVIAPAPENAVAALVFSVPPFVMGAMLGRKREAERRLRSRLDELDAERELYAEIAVRHERSRIADELHDLVGHALSVMVIQAAAGQRLAGREPERADAALVAIASAARSGERDLRRLGDMLAGGEPEGDLSLVDALVERSRASGLDARYRIDGPVDRLPLPVAHLVYRVVREGLTNALRYAAGHAVEVLIDADDAAVRVSITDHGASERSAHLVPRGGHGLAGLRQRVAELGGTFHAGSTAESGWRVEAELPLTSKQMAFSVGLPTESATRLSPKLAPHRLTGDDHA